MPIRKCVALAAQLRTALSKLNTTIKKREGTEKCYTQCGRFSGQRKSLKRSSFPELESLLAAWLKKARGNCSAIRGTLLREKSLHIAMGLGIQDFKASTGWIDGFN
jgi:hypothetical protein